MKKVILTLLLIATTAQIAESKEYKNSKPSNILLVTSEEVTKLSARSYLKSTTKEAFNVKWVRKGKGKDEGCFRVTYMMMGKHKGALKTLNLCRVKKGK